jgi:hypothetical protein
VKYWEVIANNLKNAGWSWGCVSAIDFNGRTIWIADAHRGDGQRFVVHADEILTAFSELEADLCFAGSPKVNHHWSKSEARRPNNEARNSLSRE